MKPRTFAVGQRVAVYNQGMRIIGVVDEALPDESLVYVSIDNHDSRVFAYHPKQLRRLIKKAKPEPREWEGQWVETYIGGDLRAVYLPYQPKNAPAQQMRLREVLKPGGRREKS